MPDPAHATTAQSAAVLPAYTPPQVTTLGPWQALTLFISLPIGPGSQGLSPFPAPEVK